jgi:hypothetical protein
MSNYLAQQQNAYAFSNYNLQMQELQNVYMNKLQGLSPVHYHYLTTETNREKNTSHWEEMTELLLSLPQPPAPPPKKCFWRKWL